MKTFKILNMKKHTLLLAFIFIAIAKINSQITLEKTYDSATLNLYIVNLEKAGQKYVRIVRGRQYDTTRFSLNLYNMDHSIYKSINLSSLPRFSTTHITGVVYPLTEFDVLYISQNLFDNDDDIEFMYVYGFSPGGGLNNPVAFTGIYNEDLSVIFSIYNFAPYIRSNHPQVMYPIYNTSHGTKLILSSIDKNDKSARVYSLAGKLTAGLVRNNGQNDPATSIFPNPSTGKFSIRFNLPSNADEAEIKIFDNLGKLLKIYKVDNTFNDLIIDNSDFANGVYHCTIEIGGSIIESKEIVISK